MLFLAFFALALRVWHLDRVPYGFHGDEALTGLDALWILDEGWIGPYVYPSGLGQPTGPLYFVAAVISLLGPSVFSVRLAMALIGVGAVVFTYLAARRMFDPTVAFFAAFLLAVMRWHLHLSRTGLMVGAWPCVFAATLWVLFAARERKREVLYALAGLVAGLGVYTYNAYVITLPVLASVFAVDLFGRAPAARSQARRGAVLFWLVVALMTVPMVMFALEYPEAYFYHHRAASLLGSDVWQATDWTGRLGLLSQRAGEWLGGMFVGGRLDLDDGTSSIGHPPIGPVTAALAAVGLLLATRVRNRAAAAVLYVAVLVFPLGGILTIGSGIFRRSFAIAPIVCMAAALPLAWLWRRRERAAAATVGALLMAATSFNVFGYFVLDQQSAEVWNIFAGEFRRAAEVMADLPRGRRVYFYSGRWSVDYPPRKFLAPQVDAHDRSTEFGSGDQTIEVPATFLFLDRYLGHIAAVRAAYPGGESDFATYRGRTLFRIYHVD